MSRVKLQRFRTGLILCISIVAVLLVTWLVPSLSAASFNLLFRFRGELPPPDDIVIVAVDDDSLQRIGKWPWPRNVTADALEKISRGHPQAVGLDFIYAEPSETPDDHLLAAAIKHNGRVVLPAELIEINSQTNAQTVSTRWLLPLPELAGTTAIGHAHVAPDVDGVLRSIQLSKADSNGHRLWAFGLEVLRVAEQIPATDLEEGARQLRLGQHRIALRDEAPDVPIPGVTLIRSNEMLINYLGPTGSFRQIGMADVLSGKIPPGVFENKIVLIGSSAQSMGDAQVSPFMHYGAGGSQGGLRMPGVEIHANIINTIRRGLWLKPVPDYLGFVAALAVILTATLVLTRSDGWRQIAGLGVILILITLGSFLAFKHYAIVPPLVPMLTGFVTVVPLLLLNRALAANRDLDLKLATLAETQRGFLLDEQFDPSLATALGFLGTMLKAKTTALFLNEKNGKALKYRAHNGLKPSEERLAPDLTAPAQVFDPAAHRVVMPLVKESKLLGALLIECGADGAMTEKEQSLAGAVRDGIATVLLLAHRRAQLEKKRWWFNLPRNLEWKLRAVDDVTARLLARMSFMDRVFSSVSEGVLVASIDGRIIFANREAARVCGTEPQNLIGASLADVMVANEIFGPSELREAIARVIDGQLFQMEFRLSQGTSRSYSLHLSAVATGDDSREIKETKGFSSKVISRNEPSSPGGALAAAPTPAAGKIGFVAIISDITKRKELEQMKAETLQLVSHELRAPLTSIQGLSEVLLKFPVTADESQEMLETIHAEARRLSETINRYLDVTRLESGRLSLKTKPVSVAPLIADCVRVLSPIAAEKEIQINQNADSALPALQADAPLLAQVVTNLLSNAIKYSPAGTEVTIAAECVDSSLRITVRDHGYGVPVEARDRIFEKFYRLERDVNAGIVGTGLGLPLVKEIVEKHGGRISVESELSAGSIFTIDLPIS